MADADGATAMSCLGSTRSHFVGIPGADGATATPRSQLVRDLLLLAFPMLMVPRPCPALSSTCVISSCWHS
ncbi:hypothetical protein M405DRAFT_564635 [Rhizopogon salebrosus TDB-379]|nr:hypothetical protein M405DRAFT_564635 [Rhizopogon salebrosus TDB-379]